MAWPDLPLSTVGSLAVSVRRSDWQDESKAGILGEALNGGETRPEQLIFYL